MTHSETDSSATTLVAQNDFVRHLRTKAENAAEASIHHASLSQQYLQLSQKLAQLAEQAGSAQLEDLQHSLKVLEGQLPATSTVVTPPAPLSLTTGQGSEPFSSVSDKNNSVPTPNRSSALSGVTPSEPETPNSSSSLATSASPATLNSRPRRQQTRKIVERVRAAKLAAANRVRVKAKKADLKPKQRTATEELKNNGRSITTSVGLFALAVFLMSLITLQFEVEVPLNPIVATFASEEAPVEETQPIEPPAKEPGDQTDQEVEEPVEEELPPEEPEPEPEEAPAEAEPTEAEMDDAPEPEVAVSTEAAAENSAADAAAAVDNRSDAGRKALLQKFGGSQATESAVQQGLEWLVSIQHPQGWWDFPQVGPSGNPGTVNNPIGGTAYALLPFLAAGHTHQTGNYQKQVGAGLTFLTNIGINAPAGYDLRGMINKNSDDKEPNEAYYVHGAATLALCEAYGMTKDRRLKRPAEAAIKFIVNSQDPAGGGWRYNPREPGSTSVTAIQLMALMAAKKAGIQVPDNTLQGVMHYLDSVQVDQEGRYGYEIEKKQYSGARTAMALLCRMYLGWGRDSGDLRAGVALLDKAGPYDNLYSLYFATQVMKNWGGAEWERWNTRLRDDLVAAQETKGAAKGSWKPRTGAIHAKQGGRLLTTALATLTLEVYYRYQPLLPAESPDTSITTD